MFMKAFFIELRSAWFIPITYTAPPREMKLTPIIIQRRKIPYLIVLQSTSRKIAVMDETTQIGTITSRKKSSKGKPVSRFTINIRITDPAR
jgi:hypothetical protein